jgi:hypothetical protein
MDNNGNKSDSLNVPLMPSVARRIIEELFQTKDQWRRSDLAAEVERLHLKRGGLKGTQEPVRIVKKALSDLEDDGLVYSPAYAQWRWRSAKSLGPNLLPPQEAAQEAAAEEPGEELSPEREIGEGPEVVYLYYNPNDRKLADFEARTTWECKIGRTSDSDPTGRIIGQGAKTALSRLPTLGLVIRTEDSAALEKALHASLRLMDKEVEDRPGSEWFMTSPECIEKWYNDFQAALSKLSAPENAG